MPFIKKKALLACFFQRRGRTTRLSADNKQFTGGNYASFGA
jgi:hypothetical protein